MNTLFLDIEPFDFVASAYLNNELVAYITISNLNEELNDICKQHNITRIRMVDYMTDYHKGLLQNFINNYNSFKWEGQDLICQNI